MTRSIAIELDVYQIIWSHWEKGDADENAILRRVLGKLCIINSVSAASNSENESLDYIPASTQPVQSEIKEARTLTTGKIRWVDDVTNSLILLGGEADLSEIYFSVEKSRKEQGRKIVQSIDATIRQTIEAHSSDSGSWDVKRPNLFEKVSRGRWKLRNT